MEFIDINFNIFYGQNYHQLSLSLSLLNFKNLLSLLEQKVTKSVFGIAVAVVVVV
jgi:hypothetical protein